MVSASAVSLNLGNNNSGDVAEKSSVDSLTGQVLSNELANPIVELALQSAYGYLKGLATDADFINKMNLAFGNNWNGEVASKLVQEFGGGNFSALPGIEILPSAAINGANGAFASLTNTVYLSEEFIAQNAGNPGAITSVVLEEIGHYIDSKINTSDAAGDEGDIFARLVQGQTISADELLGLKAEDDSAVLKLNGQVFWIEQSTTIPQVTFKTFEKNKYVVAEGGGGSTVNANRDVAGPWENFTLIDLNGGSLNNGDVVNIRSQNGSYVVAEGSGGGVVNANRRAAGPWEEFQVIKVNGSGQIRSGDSLALRAKNGQYVVAEGGGGANVNANRNAIGPWEKFIINFSQGPDGRLSQLANKPSSLTIDEIREYRQLVVQLPQSDRSRWYDTLQYKVPYFNQRDNEYRAVADYMCNVTTLASCLTYLGVKNPQPNRQFEDVLDNILQANPSTYPNYGGNARYWWDNLSKLATNFGVGSSGKQYMPGFSSTDLAFFKNFAKNNWESALNEGKTIMAGVYTTNPGHIVKVIDIDWNRGGIIVDDPYGKALDSGFNDYQRFNYSGSLNTTSRGSVNTQQGQDESGIGNDNFWSWSYCAEVFGDTWYLKLG
ncbi:C39 family peptidase [Microseira wollei]|uniref:Peptidase C39-like domain-containing protein n=1 Tax=Microseira wollei NIES-4236 TaxID=2530354 RepID=A0AAV3WK04_9CYAN|nr:C39 family peptidase [Microseira wollei]GET40719.1 hypothetical protein MiSe_55300 [Microseira wollei NIES-4236]